MHIEPRWFCELSAARDGIMRNKRKSFTLRISVEAMEWLKEKAKKNQRPLNFVISKILESAKRKEEEESV